MILFTKVCGGLNNAPPKCPCHNSGPYEYVILQGKRGFADVVKLSILKWGNHPRYLGEPNIITSVLTENRKARVREADTMMEPSSEIQKEI